MSFADLILTMDAAELINLRRRIKNRLYAVMPRLPLNIWCVIASYCNKKDILSIFQLNKTINRLSTYRPLYVILYNKYNIEHEPYELMELLKCRLNKKLMRIYDYAFYYLDFANFAKYVIGGNYKKESMINSCIHCRYVIELLTDNFVLTHVLCSDSKAYTMYLTHRKIAVRLKMYLNITLVRTGEYIELGCKSKVEFIQKVIDHCNQNMVNTDSVGDEIDFLANLFAALRAFKPKRIIKLREKIISYLWF